MNKPTAYSLIAYTVMTNILIAGGSGLIGRRLSRMLTEKGFEVAWLSRKKIQGIHSYLWSVEESFVEPQAIAFADYIINLAGYNLSTGRWTDARKQAILDSRVQSARLLFQQAVASPGKLKGYLSASAVGYYGSVTTEKILAEDDLPGNGFLAEVCGQWEQSANLFADLAAKVVILRTGVVLSMEGGALPRMIIPVRFGLGAPLGTGRQYLPWIHIDDLCEIYLHALQDNNVQGTFHAVAPQSVSNREFMAILSKICGKPYWLPPVPSFLLKVVLGEMSSLLLEGSRISAEKIIKAGYSFRYPDLESALSALIR